MVSDWFILLSIHPSDLEYLAPSGDNSKFNHFIVSKIKCKYLIAMPDEQP